MKSSKRERLNLEISNMHTRNPSGKSSRSLSDLEKRKNPVCNFVTPLDGSVDVPEVPQVGTSEPLVPAPHPSKSMGCSASWPLVCFLRETLPFGTTWRVF